MKVQRSQGMYNVILFASLFIWNISFSQDSPSVMDLSGKWELSYDSSHTNHLVSNTYKFDTVIILPGSIAEQGLGFDVDSVTRWTGNFWNMAYFQDTAYSLYRTPGNIKVPFWLQPRKVFVGKAWYRKHIRLAKSWKNSEILLILERCHWETTLWINNKKVGTQNSLSASHIYKIPSSYVKDGTNEIKICVDNRIKQIKPGMDAHSISDNTQTNWNGIIGEMKLVKQPRLYIKKQQAKVDWASNTVDLITTICNNSGKRVNVKITSKLIEQRTDSLAKKLELTRVFDTGIAIVSRKIKIDKNVKLWDEFNPSLYTLITDLEAGGNKYTDSITTGFRKLGNSGRQLFINDRKVFLRGTLESAIFPITGYPPVNKEEWLRIYAICKSFGLNHIRFHSWCPPEAAFLAADEMGFYLSVEASMWATVGDGEAIDQFLYDESHAIVNQFGHHPSFIMLLSGNEPAGKNHVTFLTNFVKYWKNTDNSRLYSTAAGWPAIAESDFISHSDPRIQHWKEGVNSIINKFPPTSDFDWSAIISKYNKPLISHEIGQWCVYPNFKEIDKYTGLLQPKNFEIFSDKLATNGMLHLADSFLLASGKLQVLCYKADIEAALRTPSMGGFQLLDLHDFPGQGTALVGVLDAFWEEKGYVTAAEYKKFCNSIVPLAKIKKFVLENSDTLRVSVAIANYSNRDLLKKEIRWKLAYEDGKVYRSGTFFRDSLCLGTTYVDSMLQLPLNTISHPTKLSFSLSLDAIENGWNVWVYPAVKESLPMDSILVTSEMNQLAVNALESGMKVLYTIPKNGNTIFNKSKISVGFSSIFWNTSWTNGQDPHTLGILCDPAHAVFNDFPTSYHSDYQWWDAIRFSTAIEGDKFNTKLNPILRLIDDWVTARSLGLIYECNVGKGKLIISGIDFHDDMENRPSSRQLYHSILNYMNSVKFKPEVKVNTYNQLIQ